MPIPYQSLGSWISDLGQHAIRETDMDCIYLWILEVVQGALIGAVGVLKFVHHEIAMAYNQVSMRRIAKGQQLADLDDPSFPHRCDPA